LCLCLASLREALDDLEAEIIVVDNNSQDNTRSILSRHFPEIVYIQNASNIGFSKANNQAIKQAKGEFICLINPDTIIGKDVIKQAIMKHKSLNQCGILGVKLLDGTGSFLPESKINKLTLKTATLKLIGLSDSYYNNNLQENEEGETATLVGAFMCFKAKDYKTVDGLDENYFMYGEDIDLSYQFENVGLKNYYLGSQEIIHFKGESTLRDKLYFQRFFDSTKLYFKKHYTNSTVMIGFASVFFKIAKYFKKNQMQKSSNNKILYKAIYYIGEDQDLMKSIHTLYKMKVIQIDFSNAVNKDFTRSLIVFDSSQNQFSDIISIMSKNNHGSNMFRIKIPFHNMLLGSDSSTSQGDILKL